MEGRCGIEVPSIVATALIPAFAINIWREVFVLLVE
jgi:hypothetical protein